eukprot:2962006-Prymnesium_polylepis.1
MSVCVCGDHSPALNAGRYRTPRASLAPRAPSIRACIALSGASRRSITCPPTRSRATSALLAAAG